MACMRKECKKEWMYVNVWRIHLALYLKLTHIVDQYIPVLYIPVAVQLGAVCLCLCS